jgi:hypothetical protein
MELAADVAGLDNLQDSTRRDRILALVNSYDVITRLRFQIPRDHWCSREIAAPGWLGRDEVNLRSITQADFSNLSATLTSALMKAQLIEANECLDQFSILKKRQQGLMSETIGESSMMFRPEKVLNLPITRRSQDLIRAYLVWDMGIGRG